MIGLRCTQKSVGFHMLAIKLGVQPHLSASCSPAVAAMCSRVKASASTMWKSREYSVKAPPTRKSAGAKKSVAFFLGRCRLISMPCAIAVVTVRCQVWSARCRRCITSVALKRMLTLRLTRFSTITCSPDIIVRYAVPDAPTCSRPLLSCRGSQMSTVSSSR